MKLHNKLMISYILACIIPLLTASFIIYDFSVRSLEDASLEFASIFNSQIVTNIDYFIDDYDKTTRSALSTLVESDIINRINHEDTATMNERVQNKLLVDNLLRSMKILNPEIKRIMLVTAKGNMYQQGNINETVDISILKQQEWYKEMLQSDDTLVITSIHDKSYYNHTEGTVFTIGRIIYSYGVYSGVLLIDLDPSSLITLNDEFLIARNNYNIKITVTNDKNGILYDSDAASGRVPWSQLLDNGYSDKYTTTKKSTDFILMPSKTNKGNLTVNAEIPRSSLLFKIAKINYVTYLAVLACVLIIVTTSILLSYSITKPIRSLQKKMKSAEEGQYLTINKIKSNDEIGSLIASYNNMISKIKALIEDVYIAQIKQKNAKFLALQSQINPHMLFNTLESIRMKALVKGEDEVALMIKILSRMFKLTLRKKSDHTLIRHELEYAENYIKLQNIRFNDQFSLEIQADESIKDSRIISLVVQPIIENSIQHGFTDYNTSLDIIISGELTEEKDIVLRISDNGAGMSQERMEEVNKMIMDAESDKLKLDSMDENKEESIGLKNIAERIKLHYGDNYYLRIVSSNSQGTVIEIKIPHQN